MTVTPGSISRRIGTDWLHQGSYILSVPDAAALPPAPVTDDVFAFTHDTKKLWVSRAAVWEEFSTGGGSAAPERNPVRYASSLAGGDIVGAGTQATLTIPAASYQRHATCVYVSYGAIVSATWSGEFYITGNGGAWTYTRVPGSAVSSDGRTVIANTTQVLPSDTEYVIAGLTNRLSGFTGAFRYLAPTDARFNRLEVTVI